MEAKAVGRYLRVTPRKARFVLDAVRGKSVSEALATLRFVPNEAAKYIRKIVESAAANAEHNYAMDKDALRICRAYVDPGPSLKRIHPRAMGRLFRILKRTSHITVVLTEDEKLKQIAVKAKARRPARRKKEAPQAAPAPAKQRRTAKARKAEAQKAEPEVIETMPEEAPAEQAKESED
jgi:large subunit ribosomal protein L22